MTFYFEDVEVQKNLTIYRKVNTLFPFTDLMAYSEAQLLALFRLYVKWLILIVK